MDKHKFYSCSFCGNDWTLDQGFNLQTKQCPPCDAYDRDEPAREAERQQQRDWWERDGKYIESYLRNKY